MDIVTRNVTSFGILHSWATGRASVTRTGRRYFFPSPPNHFQTNLAAQPMSIERVVNAGTSNMVFPLTCGVCYITREIKIFLRNDYEKEEEGLVILRGLLHIVTTD